MKGYLLKQRRSFLPYMTQIIGIITPSTSEVIRDILTVERIVFHCIV
ncbi:exonuclease VII large subunit [Bartonella callosciuri]|uniref:Exonuclease VII large subunit n=1 Tax=Bartonella callosciuri TaxID=686223 RepID=A0A840NN21_9HYPH|nr:exonuclease VII large subunit [Bartonella callosciuri]